MSELSPQAEAREKVNWPEGPREAALGRMELATTKGRPLATSGRPKGAPTKHASPSEGLIRLAALGTFP